ncbi:uncharacterized protein E0L32_006709 [Thyridium curvatum]|uniref:Major facilitator superfamily (MFS) profile domain-containing protein n=1 Tax=Thyridium curvatum TaxID=1093900 RepID=A0A507B640_9PEZI|nr:uncharacterized protein E0L32_006709 [Thyridium curvatum]TPX12829.1 hypothetical protein E0L32_006709 [Thyridium curvatum]
MPAVEIERTGAGDLEGSKSYDSRPDEESNMDVAKHIDSSRTIHGWKWVAAYTAMLSTTFLFSLDNTIVADIQPSIIHSFGAIDLLPWVGTGFALGTMTILPWGKAYGVFNIKPIYLANILLFEVGSALCGAAPNMTALIVGRVIAGVGGSGMYAGTLTYISVLTNMRERAAYMAGSTVVWGVGSVLGPVVGGAFAVSSATWRWGFYINLVVGAVFAPAYILLFPSVDPQMGRTLREKARLMDWPTSFTFVGGAACLVSAISFGGTVYDWNSATLVALWVVTGVLLVATTLLLTFHPGVSKEHRLYPVHFLRKPLLMNMQLQVFLAGGIVLSITYYIPLFFQFIRGDGPLDAGVRLLPLIVGLVVVSMVNGLLMPRWSFVAPWYFFGSGLVLTGTCLMSDTVHYDTPIAKIYGYTVLIGVGAGCYIVAGFSVIQSLVPPSDIANAVGVMAIAQNLGMVLFLAIAGSVYQNTALNRVLGVLPERSRAEITELIAGASSDAFKRLSESEKNIVIPQITSAMGNVWLLFLVAGALSFVASLGIGVQTSPPRFRANELLWS